MDSCNSIKIAIPNKTVSINSSDSIDDLIKTILGSSDNLEAKSDYIISINHKEKSTTINTFKQEDISEKDSLNLIPHPYFTTIEKTQITTKQILDPSQLDNIVVFSPHPDDEILGTSSLLFNCFKLNKNIKVVYMTSGKGSADPDLRQKEAILGIKELGGHDFERNLIFTNMPFYSRTDRNIEDDDYEFVRELLRSNKPDYVFLCADMFDPRQTHRKCFDCLFKVLNEDKEFKDIKVFFYYSVWYWPEEDEYSHIIPYNYEIYKCKVKAMLEHESQALTNFMGSDPRPFYQRASSRDSKIGIKYGYDFCELFYQYR